MNTKVASLGDDSPNKQPTNSSDQSSYTMKISWHHLIATLGRQVCQSSTPIEALSSSIDQIRYLLQSDRLLLYQWTQSQTIELIAQSISTPQWSLSDQPLYLEPKLFANFPQKELQVINQISTPPIPQELADFLRSIQVTSYIQIPVWDQNNLWGLLIAHQCNSERVWLHSEIDRLEEIAIYLSIAIKQTSLIQERDLVTNQCDLKVLTRTEQLEQTNLMLLEEVVERQKATEQVIERQEFLRSVLNSLFNFVAVLTPDGIIKEVNQAPLVLAGLERAEIIGQPLADTYWWNYSSTAQNQIREAIALCANDIAVRFDIPIQVQNQHQQLIDFSLQPLKSNNNLITHLIAFGIDITDRKQIELDLKAKTEELDRFFTVALDLLCIADTDGYFRRLNKEWEKTLGYNLQDLEGVKFLDYVHPEDLDSTLEQITKLKDQTQVLNFINRYRCHDGTYRWLEWRSYPLGNIIYAAARDITAFKAKELDLRQSQEILSSVLNSSLDGIMAFHSIRDQQQNQIIDFEWILSNPTACQLVGKPLEELIGKRLLEIMPGNRAEGLFDLYVKAVESGKPINHEFHYNHEGINYWFELIAVKLGDGFAVTFRNISAIKESKQALLKINQQLEERVEDLKQRNAEMLVLSEISDFLQACLTVEEACATIASLIQPLFPNFSGGIFITSSSRNLVENIAFWGKDQASQTSFHPQDCWGLRRGKIHLVNSDRLKLRCKHFLETDNIVTLCIPMIAQGETLGLLYLSSDQEEYLTDNKQQLAKTVAEQVSLAIANLYLRETLQNQSIKDPLTGLYNRRYLEESLTKEIYRAQRQQHPISLIMIDLDHFKRINDTYGHDAGDYILQSISQLLLDHIINYDIVCRYGGEEITIILPEESLETTTIRANEILNSIRELQLNYRGTYINGITASLGVASFPKHGITGSDLVRAADIALYRAKTSGRNQVIVAD